MDIVERLRSQMLYMSMETREEVAAEIERLRAQTTWYRIDDPDNPPPDDPHVRGLWINVHKGHPYFQIDSGFIDDDTGRFLGYDADDFGWDAGDYTHWMPLPTPPEDRT